MFAHDVFMPLILMHSYILLPQVLYTFSRKLKLVSSRLVII